MASSGVSSLLGRLSVFDAYSKAKDEGIQVKTLGGACVTVASVLLMIVLMLSEIRLFLSTEYQHFLMVDKTRSEALHIDVDVVFFAMRCQDLDVHIGDTRGHTYTEAKAEVTKHPFVPPRLLQEEPDKTWTKDNTPGCIVKGVLTVRKMAGMVTFRSITRRMGNFNLMGAQQTRGTNFSHQIRQLNMGPLFPGAVNPLDGVQKGLGDAEDGLIQYQYFIKVVPTIYEGRRVVETNQFSVTEFESQASGNGFDGPVPEVVLKLDFSPIMVRITETRRGFLKFLTGLCAILGGVFTVAGMVDSTVYQSSKALMGKNL